MSNGGIWITKGNDDQATGRRRATDVGVAVAKKKKQRTAQTETRKQFEDECRIAGWRGNIARS